MTVGDWQPKPLDRQLLSVDARLIPQEPDPDVTIFSRSYSKITITRTLIARDRTWFYSVKYKPLDDWSRLGNMEYKGAI